MSTPMKRRTFLAGAGALLALPLLEAMYPGRARADTPPPSPRRFITFHFPIGVNRAAWKPSGTETDWTFGASQEPLTKHKSRLCMLTNVDSSGDKTGRSSHTGPAASFLTADDVPMSRHAMGTSADQLIARTMAGRTPFRSLELGTSILNENPNDEAGFDPVLKDHLSWNAGTPLPKEVSPAAVFERLFGGGNDAALGAYRQQLRLSVLDTVSADASRLKLRLGKADGRKLDEYMTAVRELETRIQTTTATCSAGSAPKVTLDVRDRISQMFDLMVLAMRCDLTRVITFGYEHTVTQQTHAWAGVTEPYHIGVTHNQPGAPYAAVNKWIVSQLALLLDRLDATQDGAGTLLDSSIVYFSSELGDGTVHSKANLPMIVCGGGGGRIQGGRLLDRPGQGNGNVLIALMQAMDVNVTSFGNGFTTPVPGLVSM